MVVRLIRFLREAWGEFTSSRDSDELKKLETDMEIEGAMSEVTAARVAETRAKADLLCAKSEIMKVKSGKQEATDGVNGCDPAHQSEGR